MEEFVWIAVIGLIVALVGRGFFRAQDRMDIVTTGMFGAFGAVALAFMGQVLDWFKLGGNASYFASGIGAVILLVSYGLWVKYSRAGVRARK